MSNIALFTFAYAPFEGGAEIAAREIIGRSKDFKFSIFTYKFDKHWAAYEEGDNFNLIRVGRGGSSKKYYGHIWNKIFYIYKAWQEAERMHSRRRFEVIWAMMASYGGVAALLFKMNHPKVPLLLTLQEGDSERHMIFGKFGFVGLFGKKIISSADLIQCISKYLEGFAEKRGAKCPIEIVPNGVDIKLFQTHYNDLEIKSLRDNLGINDEYVILTTSRLVYKNGVDILIKAVAKLKEKRPGIKLLIIGGGPERKKLADLAKKLSVSSNVLFLGQIQQKDLPLYFRVADVFSRPSRSEGLGNSFLEAMAAGIPVIGTPVGGIVDFLKDPSESFLPRKAPDGQVGQTATGFISKPEDPDDLAEKINYVLSHPDERKKIVANAELLVEKDYSWDIVAQKMGEIFKRLIKK